MHDILNMGWPFAIVCVATIFAITVVWCSRNGG